MKVLLVFSLLLHLSYAVIECDDYFGCVNKVIERGESIQVAEKMPHFTLFKVSGAIDNSTFALLNHLEELYIENSNITSIEEGTLCNFRNLKKLHITFNTALLVITKKILGNCYNIESLSISGHQIEDNALENMPHLRELNLDGTNIPSSICTSHNLKILTIEELTDENLQEHRLRLCRNLEEINIGTVAYIEQSLFNGKTSLKSIDLYKVPIQHITKAYFSGLSNLQFLRLEECSVNSIDGDAFDDLRQLKSLIITFSSAAIQHRHLYYLNQLEELVLKQTTSVDTLHNINNYPKLESLDIEVEDLSLVNMRRVLMNLPKLRKLVFFGNSNICYNHDLVKMLEAHNTPYFEVKLEDGLGQVGFC